MKLSRRARLVVFTVVSLALIGAVVVLTADPQAMGPGILTSGPLARVHTHLEGEEHCGQCHLPNQGLADSLCLDCHEPLAARIQAKQGFHANVEAACNDCHAEHKGLDVELVRWPPAEAPFKPTQRGKAERDAFPHEAATGFALSGAHAKLDCDACHKTSLVRDAAVLAFKKEEHTYLGLEETCGSCHQDPHAPSLGADCAQCHDDEAWKPAPRFDHGQTRYPLEGKHADVTCAECHTAPASTPSPDAAPLPTFQPVAAASAPPRFRGGGFGRPGEGGQPTQGDTLPGCVACHGNPHRASAGFQRCADCHTPQEWNLAADASFDHAATGFPLDGGHAQVKCADCHGGQKLDQLEREACADCHEDHHQGAFDREMALARQSCDTCHSTADWKRPTYSTEQHPLPLIEGHAVSCEKCHGQQAGYPRLPARAPAPVGPLEQECAACHRDPHEGKFARAQPPQACVDCHGFKDFHLAELDAAGHARIGFPIQGAHMEVRCEGCHGGRTAEGGLKQMALADVTTQGCVACHEDPHRGQLGTSCSQCHTEQRFVPSTFDEARHQQSRFPLTGAHRAVPCEVCHTKDVAVGGGALAQRFKWEPAGKAPACASCHDDPHRGQFRQDCASCHGVERFQPAAFDAVAVHARLGFPLTGPHDQDCRKCHVSGLQHGEAVTYAGTPTSCAGCHLDVHLGQFAHKPQGCLACHRLEAGTWDPVAFDHQRCRFPLEGKHLELDCAACHLSKQRTAPSGEQLNVVHYVPIEGQDCDDCHQNPHAREGGK